MSKPYDGPVSVSVALRELPSDDHLTEIGRVIASWATLEADLHRLLQKLLRTDDQAARVISATLWNYTSLLNVTRQIAPSRLGGNDTESTKELLRLLGAVRELGTERGRIAHAVWWRPNDRPNPYGERLVRGKPHTVADPEVTIESLRNLCERIHAANIQILDWMLRDYPSAD